MNESELRVGDNPDLDSYLTVASSFLHGLVRLSEAKVAHFGFLCALAAIRKSECVGLDGPGKDALRLLLEIDLASADSYAYVTSLSHLIYATSLLDTFLSETTLFLFLRHPLSMGKNQLVPLRMIIDAGSRNQALTEAARIRAREISYLPFLGRLHFLRDTFGLNIVLSSKVEASLEHYSSVRNTAVHDQGIFELLLDESGRIRSIQKTCSRHPSRVTADDVSNATSSYKRVVKSVTKAVCCQVLKTDRHPVMEAFAKLAPEEPT